MRARWIVAALGAGSLALASGGCAADPAAPAGDVFDSGVADGAVADGAVADGSTADGSTADGSVADGSTADSGLEDTTADAGPPDVAGADTTMTQDSGGGGDGTGGLVPAPDVALLVDPGGCSDLAMTLGSQAGDLNLVFVHNADVAKTAYEAADGTASVTLDLATEASLELWQGIQVTFLTCNDAWNGNEEIVTTWKATAGTASLQVVTQGEHEPWDAYPGTGTLTLTDVVLSAEGAVDVLIPSLTWSAAIGWLPG